MTAVRSAFFSRGRDRDQPAHLEGAEKLAPRRRCHTEDSHFAQSLVHEGPSRELDPPETRYRVLNAIPLSYVVIHRGPWRPPSGLHGRVHGDYTDLHIPAWSLRQ